MKFTDTHCHIHETSYRQGQTAWRQAQAAGVERLICVGTDETSSREAVKFARKREQVWASVGIHPHEADKGLTGVKALEELVVAEKDKNVHVNKIVAIGECGLDYFYHNAEREAQIALLEAQLDVAHRHNLPVIFHVREAFDDFWPIYDNFLGIKGVLHSFTDTQANMERATSKGLCIGVNGISTFTKDEAQRQMFAAIPLEHLLLETDAPYLTPVPLRGKVNEPAFITHVAHHLANLRTISLEELSRATERNATNLFF
ncbi:MAG TPA: TatD family hydrolase [Candidatus Saccharimonadales bacterium]